MKNLRKDIHTAVEIYFDEKIKNASIPEEIKDRIWDMVIDLNDDIDELLSDTEKNIDYAIEEETITNSKYMSEHEEMEALRTSDLCDSYRQFYLTR